eukprot:290593-Heterocapsa_arctica.AAC.1
MVEDLQRQVSSFEDLLDSQAAHVPELPVFVPAEVPSGSGDLTSLVAKAVALAAKQHLGKKVLPVIKKGVPPSRSE